MSEEKITIEELDKSIEENEKRIEEEANLFSEFNAGLVDYVNLKIKENGGRLPLSPVFRSFNTLYFSLIQNSLQEGNKVAFVLQQFTNIAEALIRAEVAMKEQPSTLSNKTEG
jgi:hypothetical protein